MASQLGKRYKCPTCGTEILCIKAGPGDKYSLPAIFPYSSKNGRFSFFLNREVQQVIPVYQVTLVRRVTSVYSVSVRKIRHGWLPCDGTGL